MCWLFLEHGAVECSIQKVLQCSHCCKGDQPAQWNNRTQEVELTETKFDMDDYISDITPHVEIQNHLNTMPILYHKYYRNTTL